MCFTPVPHKVVQQHIEPYEPGPLLLPAASTACAPHMLPARLQHHPLSPQFQFSRPNTSKNCSARGSTCLPEHGETLFVLLAPQASLCQRALSGKNP